MCVLLGWFGPAFPGWPCLQSLRSGQMERKHLPAPREPRKCPAHSCLGLLSPGSVGSCWAQAQSSIDTQWGSPCRFLGLLFHPDPFSLEPAASGASCERQPCPGVSAWGSRAPQTPPDRGSEQHRLALFVPRRGHHPYAGSVHGCQKTRVLVSWGSCKGRPQTW